MTLKNEINKWDPISELEELQNRVKSFLTRKGDGLSLLNLGEMESDWTPAVDVSEDDREFMITADLPDVTKENVRVSVDEDILTIQGERQHESEEKTRKYHRVERSIGKYARSFHVPKGVDCGKIEAQFKAGVLKVHLPKKADFVQQAHDIPVS